MIAFPTLKSGAVMQYPARTEQRLTTKVLHFTDGSEQIVSYGQSPVKAWHIRLSELDDMELAAVASFFQNTGGGREPFRFVDPDTGTAFDNCRLKDSFLEITMEDINRGATSLVIQYYG